MVAEEKLPNVSYQQNEKWTQSINETEYNIAAPTPYHNLSYEDAPRQTPISIYQSAHIIFSK